MAARRRLSRQATQRAPLDAVSRSHASVGGVRGAAEARPESGPQRVLIVDDRDDNLMALEAVLEPLGHELLSARSGADALRMLLDTDVSAIVLDVQMPDMDGFETAKLMKSREATRTIPILFLTAVGLSLEHELRGYEVGAVDYICKPFEPRVLQAKVRAAVRWGAELRSLRRASRVYEEAADALSAVVPATRAAEVPEQPSAVSSQVRRSAVLRPSTRLLSLELDASLDAPRLARVAVREALKEEPGDRADIVVLLVSELLANAVLHASSSAHVYLDVGEDTIRVEVQDEAPDLPPHQAEPDPTDEGGRGLQLVARLAQRAGWTRKEDGKSVWFELTRASS